MQGKKKKTLVIVSEIMGVRRQNVFFMCRLLGRRKPLGHVSCIETSENIKEDRVKRILRCLVIKILGITGLLLSGGKLGTSHLLS